MYMKISSKNSKINVQNTEACIFGLQRKYWHQWHGLYLKYLKAVPHKPLYLNAPSLPALGAQLPGRSNYNNPAHKNRPEYPPIQSLTPGI